MKKGWSEGWKTRDFLWMLLLVHSLIFSRMFACQSTKKLRVSLGFSIPRHENFSTLLGHLNKGFEHAPHQLRVRELCNVQEKLNFVLGFHAAHVALEGIVAQRVVADVQRKQHVVPEHNAAELALVVFALLHTLG